MANIEELRAKFLKANANLPEPEREQVIAIIDKTTYSWNRAFDEVSGKTALGNKILEKLKLMGIL